jgi:hypothetical protein
MMNAVPADQRGAAGGMIATVMNTSFVLSIGIFFSLMVAGLTGSQPHTMSTGLIAQGIPAHYAHELAVLPPIGVLFAAFLGYNPMQQLLGGLLKNLHGVNASYLTGREFFPKLITTPFRDGLREAFLFAIIASVIGAVACLLTGKPRKDNAESVGEELAAVAGEGSFEPTELVTPDTPDTRT